MKKSFFALITVILCVYMFFACDMTDILDKADLTEYNEKAGDTGPDEQIPYVKTPEVPETPETPEVPNDDFLSGIYHASIYYDNTLSITPLSEREMVSIHLHTNDIEQARNWSILTQENGSANRELVKERETEKYFEFLWVEESHNLIYGLLSRIHRSDYFIPLFDTFNFFPRSGDFQRDYTVGIYNGDFSVHKVNELIEYLWGTAAFFSESESIIETNILEKENIIEYHIQSQQSNRIEYRNTFVYNKETKVLTFAERKWIEEPRFTKIDFFEEYGLTLEFAGIWNDFMPGGGWELTPEGERASICVVQIKSLSPLPQMEVSANIIADSVRFDNVLFYDIYGGDQKPALYYWRDYRPVIGFRVPASDRYTMEITVKINGKQETLTVRDMVGATY